MVKYDKVTAQFIGGAGPMVVEQISGLAKSHFFRSRNPVVQVIDVPLGPTGGGLFDLKLNRATV